MHKPQLNTCSVCEKQLKIIRNYRAEAYCSNCYPQWFPQKKCKICKKIQRIHLNGQLCLNCERLTDCARCGRQAGLFSIGKITNYGAICKTCYLYFRERKECAECGKLSRNVSRSPLANHNQLLCLSCYRKYSFATCKNCKRYRKIDNKRKQLCIKCNNVLLSACSRCKNEMPSGYGKICSTCTKRTLLFKLIRINTRLFHNKEIITAYKKFIFWCIDKFGVSLALHKSNSHVSFFITCDDNWRKIPDYSVLLTYFRPNGLRHHLTVLRWLIDNNLLVIDEKLKAEIAETDKIQALFNKLQNPIPCIDSYYKHLKRKYNDGKTSIKSIRLALQPAIDLMSSQTKIVLPTQTQLNNYLALKIGQTAAISGFICHLNEAYYCEIEIDRKHIQTIKSKILRKHCDQILIALYQQKTLTESEKIELIYAVLYSLHNVLIRYPRKENILELEGAYYYHENAKMYFLPTDVYSRLI
ncbi:hypothetical protein CIK86_12575 [Pseudoalteromonas sp. JB197]|nr:hypothetical protein CIK86_12575 [Pseudoalteromonas sp. JB197]SJN22936.1 FIGfam110555 [Pseudoalteromonas sp. JB197]